MEPLGTELPLRHENEAPTRTGLLRGLPPRDRESRAPAGTIRPVHL